MLVNKYLFVLVFNLKNYYFEKQNFLNRHGVGNIKEMFAEHMQTYDLDVFWPHK